LYSVCSFILVYPLHHEGPSITSFVLVFSSDGCLCNVPWQQTSIGQCNHMALSRENKDLSILFCSKILVESVSMIFRNTRENTLSLLKNVSYASPFIYILFLMLSINELWIVDWAKFLILNSTPQESNHLDLCMSHV
jgi:hypothetical protein